MRTAPSARDGGLLPPPRPHHVLQHVPREDFSVYAPAGFILRWYAMTLDLTFATPLDVFVHQPFERYLERLYAFGHLRLYWLLYALLTAIPVLLYFVVPTMIWGQTLGKRIVGVRVVSKARTAELGLWQVLGRETLGRAASVLLGGVGFLMAAAEPHKRALHDRLFGTDVIGYQVRQAEAKSAGKTPPAERNRHL
jgi:uncharacterized RDD family membrane protein YckC